VLTPEEYWEQHRRRIAATLSVVVGRKPNSEAYLRTSPYGTIIDARIWFDDDAFLDVHELVIIDGDLPHRVIYSYHLHVDGAFVHRWDRDPKLVGEFVHHVNRPHRNEVTHEPADAISLPDAVACCWAIIDDYRRSQAAKRR